MDHAVLLDDVSQTEGPQRFEAKTCVQREAPRR